MEKKLSPEIQSIIDKNRKINANNHHCLVRRLRNRSIGRKIPTANFAQNIPINGSLTKIIVPQNCSPKRFSPCGKYMIALGDHSVELFRFKGSDSVVKTRQKFRDEKEKFEGQPPIHDRTRNIRLEHTFSKLRSESFSKAFQHVHTYNLLRDGNKRIYREFSLFVGRFLLVASFEQHDMTEGMDLRDFQYSNETIGSPHDARSIKHEHYTFHLLDYQDKLRVVSDYFEMRHEFVVLYNNQGVTVHNDNLAILGLHQQQIYLFKITPDGRVVKNGQIGAVIYPGDFELLRMHPEYRRDFRETLGKSPVLTSFKQKLLTFLFKNLPHEKFWSQFSFLRHLKIWRIHLVDDDTFLIKLAAEKTILEAVSPVSNPQLRSQLPSRVALFVMFEISSGEILGITENISESFYKVMIDFQHTMEFQSQPSKYKLLRTCTIHSKSAREKYKAQLEKAKYGSRAEAIKHILWQCPPPPQVHTPSPYMRVDLFSFDDTFISSFYKPRKLPESPIRFFCRCCNSQVFALGGDIDPIFFSSHHKNSQVVYIFHPHQPFVISVLREQNSSEIYNFHFYDPAIPNSN
ncbi:Oidioi.mRNA.OKI2018_I69.chr2.g5041.t1.cds [Oikopleura dioica]|uniref:Oidioi.mRNA.OKI2018_I69.chr2.g5041.t1.cds n=1 Tax=Oikopleura dioica TaxID=34765 RepID=A0ABN7T3J4_OIKDI|nr:Oidioi.mRNA.OKI2018_I69.chr2.g5041.t1.cds [Oikopleura dioica]